MMVNNNTGVIQQLEELITITHEHGSIFHTDAIQGFGKIPVNIKSLKADLVSLSAHKIYGPKGVGALYIGKGIEISPLLMGGGHEHGLRSGTENLIGITGFGKAGDQVPKIISKMKSIQTLRDHFEEGLFDIFDTCFVNGAQAPRVSNTTNMIFPGFRGESLVYALSKRGVFFSSGSACSAGSPQPAADLLAMGLSEKEAHSSLRFSLGVPTTKEEIEYALNEIEDVITHSKNIVKFVPCR
jgi:cysteine sulfinate desulfinase/cysteine desulfurase-like protein